MTRASTHRTQRSRSIPPGWEETSDEGEYEYVPLRLPPEINRVTASMRLSIQAEYGGWELSRVRAYTDGSRQVLLRRRKTSAPVPDPGM
jgi:hypothetical protein